MFDTIRIHGGAPFRFDAHLRRLARGLQLLRIESPVDLSALRKGAKAVVGANALEDGLLRLTVTAGDATSRGSVSMMTRPLPDVPREVVLHVAQSVRRGSGPFSSCKTISRAVESAALREAHAHGAFDSVILNEVGRIAETSTRNLFLAIGGQLVTPPESEGALPGVTRATVLELAERLGTSAVEAPVSWDALKGATEVFLTGSGVGILPVAKVDAKAFTPVPGPHAAALADAYIALLDAESRW